MATREQNEKQFDSWIELSTGRLYKKMVQGKYGWYAVYYKEVDEQENTTRFWQEIRDDHGELREIHETFPVDQGHVKL